MFARNFLRLLFSTNELEMRLHDVPSLHSLITCLGVAYLSLILISFLELEKFDLIEIEFQ